jgi:hypothetical protein
MSKTSGGWSRDELERFAACLRDDLRCAGRQFSIEFTSPSPFARMITSALGEPADTAIELRLDGVAVMSLEFWSGVDHLEHLEGLMNQVQDVVMESTRERWPMCPDHDHELVPRAGKEWIEWECPETGVAIARFGQL